MTTNGNGLRRRSVIAITGELADPQAGVTQNLELEHDAGAPDAYLISEAFKYARQAGGLMVEGPSGSVYFYPLVGFARVNFKVKPIIVVSSVTQ